MIAVEKKNLLNLLCHQHCIINVTRKEIADQHGQHVEQLLRFCFLSSLGK